METIAEKGISLVIFFLITMIGGSIPILLFSQCRGRMSSRRGQTIISLLNCFAGGVFLATCILNLLVEGFEEYETYKQVSGFDSDYPFFHLCIGVGFFAVAFVERFATLMSTRSCRRKRGKSQSCKDLCTEDFGRNGEMAGSDDKDLTCEAVPEKQTNGNLRSWSQTDNTDLESGNEPDSSPQSNHVFTVSSSMSHATIENGHRGSSGNPRDHHSDGEIQESTERFTGHSGVVAITIFLALSFHTIFDGLAVGLQETDSDIWTTTIAISIHKTIVAVSLGLELASSSPGKTWRAFLFLFVFALMAPLGVGIGMGITSGHVDTRAHHLASGLLQATATGSFLYVTFFEVLGEELGHRSSVLKILMTMLGFGAMAVAKIWDTD